MARRNARKSTPCVDGIGKALDALLTSASTTPNLGLEQYRELWLQYEDPANHSSSEIEAHPKHGRVATLLHQYFASTYTTAGVEKTSESIALLREASEERRHGNTKSGTSQLLEWRPIDGKRAAELAHERLGMVRPHAESTGIEQRKSTKKGNQSSLGHQVAHGPEEAYQTTNARENGAPVIQKDQSATGPQEHGHSSAGREDQVQRMQGYESAHRPSEDYQTTWPQAKRFQQSQLSALSNEDTPTQDISTRERSPEVNRGKNMGMELYDRESNDWFPDPMYDTNDDLNDTNDDLNDTNDDPNDNDSTALSIRNLLGMGSPSDSDSVLTHALLPCQSAAASASHLPPVTRTAAPPRNHLLTSICNSPTHQRRNINAAFPKPPTPFDIWPAIDDTRLDDTGLDDTRLDSTLSDSTYPGTACISLPAMTQAPGTKKRRRDEHPSSGPSGARVDGAVTQWMRARNQKKNEMDAAEMIQADLQAAHKFLSLLLPTTSLVIHKDPPLLWAHRRLPGKHQAVILLPPPATTETADDDEADEDDGSHDWAIVSVTKLADGAIMDTRIHTATTRGFRATCQRVEMILSTAMNMRAVDWKEIEWQRVPLPLLWDNLHDDSLTGLIQCVATKVLLIAADPVPDRLLLWAWLGALVATSDTRARVSEINSAIELPETIYRAAADQTDDGDLARAFKATMAEALRLSSGSATLSQYRSELNLILECAPEASSPEETSDRTKKAQKVAMHLRGLLELYNEDSEDYRICKEKYDEAEKQAAQAAQAESKSVQELYVWIALSKQTAETERWNLEAEHTAYLNQVESQLVSMKEQVQNARQPLRL
ncbi:Hypothetical predicted protein [Lecanosticta acicola]|uniref:Uncharacterized protein n=1 Tax=Lecanosticta acicola TaxID=111012 RepID=A0AAI8Z5A6_9PEZI|nr:Hypothetical predicted protein [Lecanosticta acicola]